MNDMLVAFAEWFGSPLPPLLRPPGPVTRVRDDGLLYGSASAVDHPYLVQAEIAAFLTAAPTGYYLAGFWGHGFNSYAFYYLDFRVPNRLSGR